MSTLMTVLSQTEELHAPPSLTVLVVAVVEDSAYLTVAAYDETNTETYIAGLESIAIDRFELVRALGFEVVEEDE